MSRDPKSARWLWWYTSVVLPLIAAGSAVLLGMTLNSLFSEAYAPLKTYFSTGTAWSLFLVAVYAQPLLYVALAVLSHLSAVALPRRTRTAYRLNWCTLALTAVAVAWEITVSCWLIVPPLLTLPVALVVAAAAWVLPNVLYFRKHRSDGEDTPPAVPQITVTDTGIPVDLSSEEVPAPDEQVPDEQVPDEQVLDEQATDEQVLDFCRHCGAELVVGASFCRKCGKAVEPAVALCAQCGAKLVPNAKFCRMCGEKVK